MNFTRIAALISLSVLSGACQKQASTNTTQTTTNPAPQTEIAPVAATPQPATKTVTLEPEITDTGLDAKATCALPPETTYLTPPAIPKQITGRIGLYVARIPAGSKDFTPIKAIQINPQGQFPLASNFKQSVLHGLMRDVDAGHVKLSEKFSITNANRSYGEYPYDNSDIRQLALRMIQNSDNTATDILFRRIGIGSVQPMLNNLHLCNTRVLLPTKSWWTAQAGLGGKDFPKYALVKATQKFASYPLEAQLKIAARLDAQAQQINPEIMRRFLDNGYFAGRNGGVETMSLIDRNIQNASTPAEWARFIHHEFMNSNLSALSQKFFKEIMNHGKGKYLIRVPFGYYGGKSGNTARVLTYSGYLEAKSGDRLIYVYFNDSSLNLTTRDETPQAFNLINASLRKIMRPSDLVFDKKELNARAKTKMIKQPKAAKSIGN
jgi:beta-lactamase class A